MNAVAYFEIQSANPENAVAFYQAIFGWSFTSAEQIPIPYWRIETPGIRGGLLQRPAATPPPECGTNAFVCSIEVADIDAVSDKITSLGGRVRCQSSRYRVCVGMPTFSIGTVIRSGCSRRIRRRDESLFQDCAGIRATGKNEASRERQLPEESASVGRSSGSSAPGGIRKRRTSPRSVSSRRIARRSRLASDVSFFRSL